MSLKFKHQIMPGGTPCYRRYSGMAKKKAETLVKALRSPLEPFVKVFPVGSMRFEIRYHGRSMATIRYFAQESGWYFTAASIGSNIGGHVSSNGVPLPSLTGRVLDNEWWSYTGHNPSQNDVFEFGFRLADEFRPWNPASHGWRTAPIPALINDYTVSEIDRQPPLTNSNFTATQRHTISVYDGTALKDSGLHTYQFDMQQLSLAPPDGSVEELSKAVFDGVIEHDIAGVSWFVFHQSYYKSTPKPFSETATPTDLVSQYFNFVIQSSDGRTVTLSTPAVLMQPRTWFYQSSIDLDAFIFIASGETYPNNRIEVAYQDNVTAWLVWFVQMVDDGSGRTPTIMGYQIGLTAHDVYPYTWLGETVYLNSNRPTPYFAQECAGGLAVVIDRMSAREFKFVGASNVKSITVTGATLALKSYAVLMETAPEVIEQANEKIIRTATDATTYYSEVALTPSAVDYQYATVSFARHRDGRSCFCVPVPMSYQMAVANNYPLMHYELAFIEVANGEASLVSRAQLGSVTEIGYLYSFGKTYHGVYAGDAAYFSFFIADSASSNLNWSLSAGGGVWLVPKHGRSIVMNQHGEVILSTPCVVEESTVSLSPPGSAENVPNVDLGSLAYTGMWQPAGQTKGHAVFYNDVSLCVIGADGQPVLVGVTGSDVVPGELIIHAVTDDSRNGTIMVVMQTKVVFVTLSGESTKGFLVSNLGIGVDTLRLSDRRFIAYRRNLGPLATGGT